MQYIIVKLKLITKLKKESKHFLPKNCSKNICQCQLRNLRTKWVLAVTQKWRWLNGKKTRLNLFLGLLTKTRKELLRLNWSRLWKNFKRIKLLLVKCLSFLKITTNYVSKIGQRQMERWRGNISATTATSGNGGWPTLNSLPIQSMNFSQKHISSRCRVKMLNTKTWLPRLCVYKEAWQKPSRLNPSPRRKMSFLAEKTHFNVMWWGEKATFIQMKTQPLLKFRTKLSFLNLKCDKIN